MAVIDLRQGVVYWFVIGPAIAMSLILGPGGILGAGQGLLIAAGVFGTVYVLGRRLYAGAEPMGTGDVAIAALLGTMAGFPAGLAALLIGSLAAGVGALVALLAHRAQLDSSLPFGPSLCLGGAVTLCLIPSA